MMDTLVAAIDCGTSAVKTAIFDLDGKIKGIIKKECPIVYYKDGRIEQNPELIVKQAFSCLKETIKDFRINPKKIASVSISNQRATLICVDKHGKPLGNAISWQDTRGTKEANLLRKKINDIAYYNITGLPNNPVFSLAKVLWIKKYSPSLYKKAAKLVLIHDYLLKNLGCNDFFIDHSNASLTGMLNVSDFHWSEAILKSTGISKDKLSCLVASAKVIGTVSAQASKRCGLLAGTPIVSGGGDQQCAGLGAGSIKPGVVEITLGTAAVVLVYSNKRIKDSKMRITCCAYAMPGKWEVEGLVNSGSASLDWIRRIISDKKYLSDRFFKEVSRIKPGSGGILFYPYFAGASAPNWNPSMRAMFLGLAYPHDRVFLVRAVMEGVFFQIKQILDVFDCLRIPVDEIRLTGGCSDIETLNQMQADIYGKKVSTLKNPEASLLGAAMLAASGIGVFTSLEQAAIRMVKLEKHYIPNIENLRIYKKIYRYYCQTYKVLENGKIFQRMP